MDESSQDKAFSDRFINCSNPRMILEQILPLLEKDGQLKTEEINTFVWFMKNASGMSHKCLLLNCLKNANISPEAKDNILQCLTVGGWLTLNKWLEESSENINTSFLCNLLIILQKIPISMTLLKEGSMAKIIKKLNNHKDLEVQKIAKKILIDWKKFVFESTHSNTTLSEEDLSKIDGSTKDKKKDIESIIDISLRKKQKSQPDIRRTKFIDDIPKSTSEPNTFLNALNAASQSADKFKIPRKSVTVTSSNRNSTKKNLDKSITNDLSSSKIFVKDENDKQSKNLAPPFDKSDKVDNTCDEQSSSNNSDTSLAIDIDENTKPYKSILSTSKKKNSSRRVSWKSEEDLLKIKYFDSEIDDVNHEHRTFTDARHHESLKEKEAIHLNHQRNDQILDSINSFIWKGLQLIENSISLIERGSKSNEKKLQTKRESSMNSSQTIKCEYSCLSPTNVDIESAPVPLIPLVDNIYDSNDKKSKYDVNDHFKKFKDDKNVRNKMDIPPYDQKPNYYQMNEYENPNANSNHFSNKKFNKYGDYDTNYVEHPKRPRNDDWNSKDRPVMHFETRFKHDYNIHNRFPIHQNPSIDINMRSPFPNDFQRSRPQYHHNRMDHQNRMDHPRPNHPVGPFRHPEPEKFNDSFNGNNRIENIPNGAHINNYAGQPPFKNVRSVICRHFINRGCRNGDDCRFLHPGINDK